MSIQVLARRWRPQTFQEVVGQRHVVAALCNALSSGRLHHAYLFSGTRGVGKTSLARLFAKGLNCEVGITDHPCGKCSHCLQIVQGRFVDLIEIDAASRTKVEDIRELLDNVQYMPTQGRFKVYLIDEIHMLSRSSFNALLKTLEEPPSHVKFLFATTDAQKLPITILSRCLHFHLRHLSESQIEQQLDKILIEEQIPSEGRAIALLARIADGSMRDALSLADQAIALGAGVINYDIVIEMLGLPDQTLALKLVESLIDGESVALMQLVSQISTQGNDWDLLLVEILALLHQIAMLQLSKDYPINNTSQQHILSQLAQRITPTDLQIYYQIITQGRSELLYAPNLRIGVEMLLLRALAFHPTELTDVAENLTQAPIAEVSLELPNDSKVRQIKEGVKGVEQTTQRVNPTTDLNTASADSEPDSVYHAESSPKLQRQSAVVNTDLPTVETIRGTTPAIATTTTITPKTAAIHIEEKVSLSSVDKANSVPSITSQAIYRDTDDSLKEQANFRAQVLETTKDQVTTGKSDKTTQLLQARERLKKRGEQQTLKKSEVPQTAAVNTRDFVSKIAGKSAVSSAVRQPMPAYQWENSDLDSEPIDVPTVNQLKVQVENLRSIELLEKIKQESIDLDSWSWQIEQLTLPNITKQLLLNSRCQVTAVGEWVLYVRPSHWHLVTESQRNLIAEALSQIQDRTVTLDYIKESASSDLTPMEWREKIYQQKLQQAQQDLQQDKQLQLIQTLFLAELDEHSIQPI